MIIQKGIWKGLASSVGKGKHNEITFLLLFVHGKSKNVTLAKLKMIPCIVKMLSNQENKKKGQVHDWMLHCICFHTDLPFYWKYQAHRSRFHGSELLDLIRKRKPSLKVWRLFQHRLIVSLPMKKGNNIQRVFPSKKHYWEHWTKRWLESHTGI